MKWLRWNLPMVAIALVLPASAQSVDPSIRQTVEALVATFTEHYNKQDAAGVAGTFTKDGVLVSQSPQGAVWSGTQALAQRYEGLFKLGVGRVPHHRSGAEWSDQY
jgi:ketosteroid isomerase-like protein